MSTKYDEYLSEHREGVVKGLQWMDEHLRGRGLFELSDLTTAQYMAEHHDESKDSIEEYEAYDRYFYGGNRSAEVVNGFNYAWLHHIHNNPHHWQYWVLINDDEKDGTVALEMPVCYILEMIADWWSFSWKKGNLEEIFDWYNDHRERIIFHKKTKTLVEKILDAMKKELELENKSSNTDDHLEHHGVLNQEWGVRNGPPYPLNAAKVAQKIFDRASQKSKVITSSVEDAANSAGGELHGLEHQLKTVDSIERKINKKVDEKDMSVSNAASSIKDALRYTVIAPTDDFVNMYEGFKDSMARQGYVETSCDNYFDKFNKGEVKHKAVQSNFADTDGYEFEVQFHTPESQDAKDKKLPLYEERRSSGVSESRKRELEKQMEDLALNVPDPEGIESIRTHR